MPEVQAITSRSYAPARFEAEPSRLTDNDDEFFLEDERTGRRVWRVQVG